MSTCTPAPHLEPFALLLRTYRQGRQLSANQLARAIGIDPSAVTRMEHAERAPSVTMLRRLIDGLHLGPVAQRRLALAATGDPDAAAWAQDELHAATLRAANAILAGCPCTRCTTPRAEAQA